MFLCLSTGFHVEFDLSKPPGHRVQSLSILCTKCRVPHYEPVQDKTVYKVVLPSYLVTGGDGFSMIRDEKLKHSSGETCLSELWKVAFVLICFLIFIYFFQGIWTFLLCPTTSHKENKFIRLLKNGSRFTTQPLDCKD